MPAALPPQIRFLERGWLNCNQILLKSAQGNALVDSGYGAHARETLRLLRQDGLLGDEPLGRLINTHCHSDHMGGNAEIARRYGCRVSVPTDEARLIEDWDEDALWLKWTDQQCERFRFDDAIAPGQRLRLGDLEWQAIAAAGHDMGALVFYCAEHGALISGDALWESGMGVIVPLGDVERQIAAALDTLEHIEALGVRIVLPGHGRPFSGVREAVRRARTRLQSLRADPVRMAQHVMKVMLVFALLEKGQMAQRSLPDYLLRVPCYRVLNERFGALSASELAETLVADLQRVFAVTLDEGWIRPTMPA